ncbi:MAG: LysM peptidoglycan-binding domain-containing protein [Verrucomicrobiales bacterium]
MKYDPAKLKTPTGHGLEKKEYPFDDDGKYRKDWVKANASGRTGSSYPQRERAAASSSTPAPSDDSSSDYPTYAEVSAREVSAPEVSAPEVSAPDQPPAPPTEETAASPQYHKVATGDTLFALARRYSTTVDELKRVNGLSGDSIHVGQSLRVP